MINKWLYTRVDNAALVVFRIIFGLLITIEAWGAIATGWIDRTLLEGDFTFNFIGFDFLQPLSGSGMHWYYGVLGLFGICVMLGIAYRISTVSYGVMWATVYLMQKSSYNNHYYLLLLLLGIMALLPAHRYFSVDSWLRPKIKRFSMPRWVYVVIIAQLWIVYTYAAVAKIYPDWLDLTVVRQLMLARKDYWGVGSLLQQEWAHYFIAYAGILFDGLVIPALLWKPTRKFAFITSIFFHLFNSFVFHIGIFPYMSLAFTIFFFPPKTVQRIFLPWKTHHTSNLPEQAKQFLPEETLSPPPKYHKIYLSLFVIYFTIQLALPLRHWFIRGDVLWTEEGHRLSWRMMLRSRTGHTEIYVVDKSTEKRTKVNLAGMLSLKQHRAISTKPDVIWQFCQRLRKEYDDRGKKIEVYVNCRVSINGHPFHTLIDPKVDMAAARWDYFWHNDWILLPDLYEPSKSASKTTGYFKNVFFNSSFKYSQISLLLPSQKPRLCYTSPIYKSTRKLI